MTDLDALALRVQLPGFPGTTATDEVLDLLHEGLGGVCLFGSNTAAGSHALAELTAAVETARPNAVVAMDEEGGDVSRLHALEGSPVLGAAALGAADDLALTRATGRAVGADLAAVGVTLDLAPVADINTNPDNPVIGTRSFGADHERVAAHVAAWVEGLREAGIGACAKHFPGHGDTARDSHLDLPAGTPTWTSCSCASSRRSRRRRSRLGRRDDLSPARARRRPGHPGHAQPQGARPAPRPARVPGRRGDRRPRHGRCVGHPHGGGGRSARSRRRRRPPLPRCRKDVSLVRAVQAAVVAAVRSGSSRRNAARRRGPGRPARGLPRRATAGRMGRCRTARGRTTCPDGGGAVAGPRRGHRRPGDHTRLDRRRRGAVGAPPGRRTGTRRGRRRRSWSGGAAGTRPTSPARTSCG